MNAAAPALLRTLRPTLRIPAGADAVRSGLAGAVLHVRGGRVWLTQDRDQQDYVLDAGAEVRIGNAGTVVIHALRDAEVEVIAARPARGDLAARLVRAAASLLPATSR
jgi:hypothetical protein